MSMGGNSHAGWCHLTRNGGFEDVAADKELMYKSDKVTKILDTLRELWRKKMEQDDIDEQEHERAYI